MSIYYFTVFDDEVTEDYEGAELADDAAAHAYAVASALSLAAETVRVGHLDLSDHIEILNAARATVGTVTLREAIAIKS